MLINLEFEFFQEVYLKTDPEQLPRQITQVDILPGGVSVYWLSCGVMNSKHYIQEIATERNQATIFTN